MVKVIAIWIPLCLCYHVASMLASTFHDMWFLGGMNESTNVLHDYWMTFATSCPLQLCVLFDLSDMTI